MQTTIASLLAYIERQAGPALATVRLAMGGDLESWLGPIMDAAEARMRPHHHAALAQHVRVTTDSTRRGTMDEETRAAAMATSWAEWALANPRTPTLHS